MKVGVLFGGPSREREISFAGGRTVYDNLDKTLFEAVPIFIDSHRNFILLDWQYLYKGTIRDFYPPASSLPESPNNFQVYLESLGELTNEERDAVIEQVGRRVDVNELAELIDFAFLALHGEFGEDGVIQGLLEAFDIPYSGSGKLPSAIGMNKATQKQLMHAAGWAAPPFVTIQRDEWMMTEDTAQYFEAAKSVIGDKLVVRPANQGSSIGVAIIDANLEAFEEAVDNSFFLQYISAEEWTAKSDEQKLSAMRSLTDIREGIGFPLSIGADTIYHPEDLLDFLDEHFANSEETLLLEGHLTESEAVIEGFIDGREFSCIVARHPNGGSVALPPTEILKGQEVFDYRSKYLAGLSRKVTPIDLPNEQIEHIRHECERLFDLFGFHTYARIDGFIQQDGTVYLNDPNTTSGMLPSSFFFHQAAEIGLNPSQFLTYLIRTSLEERMDESVRIHPKWEELADELDDALEEQKEEDNTKKKIAVLLGGYSSERHISVESGRNIFEKLASSGKYEPIPIFLTGNSEEYRLFQLPINILLKDNADDIRDKVFNYKKHPIVEQIKEQCAEITDKYCPKGTIFEPKEIHFEDLVGKVDAVFIALHGRPGEDGAVQQELEKLGIPYNGSTPESSQITINKYNTNQLLKQHGLLVADQGLFNKADWDKDSQSMLDSIEQQFNYPIIAKPVDDGCSSAVKKITERSELEAFLQMIFRPSEDFVDSAATILDLKPKEEFPQKPEVLIESFIDREGAKYFLEITGGMLTHTQGNGERAYEVFEPSEALASGKVLSLEEKFLAGEGQNITPARFGTSPEEYTAISEQVKADLKKTAEILNVEGYCRIDAFVRVSEDLKVETVIIEVNSLPGMTPATCIFHQAAINSYKPFEFIDNILAYAFRDRHEATA